MAPVQAVKAASALEARTVAAQARLGSEGMERQVFSRNSFKCSKCMRTHHAQFSPLVLCDFCPRQTHLACMEGGYGSLPEGDWACSKCTERHELNLRKLVDLEAKKREAMDRVAAVRSLFFFSASFFTASFASFFNSSLASFPCGRYETARTALTH